MQRVQHRQGRLITFVAHITTENTTRTSRQPSDYDKREHYVFKTQQCEKEVHTRAYSGDGAHQCGNRAMRGKKLCVLHSALITKEPNHDRP